MRKYGIYKIYYIIKQLEECCQRVGTLLSCELVCHWILGLRVASCKLYPRFRAHLMFINMHNIVTYLWHCLGTLANLVSENTYLNKTLAICLRMGL